MREDEFATCCWMGCQSQIVRLVDMPADGEDPKSHPDARKRKWSGEWEEWEWRWGWFCEAHERDLWAAIDRENA